MKSVTYEKVKKFKNSYPSTIAWRIKSHCKVVDENLAVDEEVLYAFTGQHNDVFYNIMSTAVFVITNKRLLIATKRVFFGYFLYTITPDLFNDLTVISGLVFGKVIIDTVKERVVISNLSKASLKEISTTVTQLLIEEKEELKSKKDNQ